MKRLIISSLILFAVGLSAPQTSQAQGTTYVSNLGETSSSGLPVASDAWLSVYFLTGANAGGYTINSVELAMGDASGTPSSFSVMIYNLSGNPAGIDPGSNIATVSGPSNPSTAGVYTYTPISPLLLQPSLPYFVVITAGTPTANGSYEWNTVAPSGSGGWTFGVVGQSVNGLNWTYPSPGYRPQFAITATAVPEPSVLASLALGGLWLMRFRRR